MQVDILDHVAGAREARGIAVIIDESGSMRDRKNDVIGGYRKLIEDQRQQPGECSVSLTKFGDVSEVIYVDKPVHDVPLPLSYSPGPTTALHDAIGQTITALGKRLAALPEDQRPGKVLVLIITDGQENCSKEYKGHQIREMIEHQTSKYGWVFNFMGCALSDIAVANTAQDLGIPIANATSFAGSQAQMAFEHYSQSATRTRDLQGATAAQVCAAMSYSAEDRATLSADGK